MDLIAIFIFYNKATGVQARLAFSNEFKHCNIITFDGEHWIVCDFDRGGLITRCIKTTSGARLVRNLKTITYATAIISVEVTKRHHWIWSPWWVRSCNEICRYASGVHIPFTFNPTALYKKLLKYDGKRNYKVLSAWRRSHGISGRIKPATNSS